MINQGGSGYRRIVAEIGPFGLDAIPLAAAWCPNERFPRHLRHLPRDYEL